MSEVLCKVRQVAERVVEINRPYYSSDLIQLIPGEILEIGLNDNNLYTVEGFIDELRFRKETELLRMRGITVDKERSMPVSVSQEFNKILNVEEETNALPLDQQKMVREIKFLFNVAATVIHQ